MKLEIYRVAAAFSSQMWRWRVTARNGRIVAASSEGFSRASGAKRNLRTTLRHLVKLVDEQS